MERKVVVRFLNQEQDVVISRVTEIIVAESQIIFRSTLKDYVVERKNLVYYTEE